jgi:hypothetical protein
MTLTKKIDIAFNKKIARFKKKYITMDWRYEQSTMTYSLMIYTSLY